MYSGEQQFNTVMTKMMSLVILYNIWCGKKHERKSKINKLCNYISSVLFTYGQV